MSDSTKDPNEALIHYLDRYCLSEATPGYAVLLRGPWGSGKTWFIEKYRKRLSATNVNSLYVSLFGVRSALDITDQFFVQIHPRLGNKKVQKGWSIIKGMFKLGLKIDLDLDGKDDDSLQLSLPDLGKWASTEGAVLIFDDLERAIMPIDEVLGFINQFVEHDGYRVILLANESAAACQSLKYPTIKEKVIGRSFEINPNTEAAFNCFVAELPSEMARNIVDARRQLVLKVIERANYKNLRQLRQAIFDFADLLSCFGSQQYEGHFDFIDRLLEDTVTLSIEYRAGAISGTDIRDVGKPNWNRYLARGQNDDSQAQPMSEADQAFSRHGFDEFVTLALLPESYAQFFATGYLLPESATEALRYSPYLANENTASWRRLWYWPALQDDQFSDLANDVYGKLVSLEYSDEGEFLHASALILFLSSQQLIKHTSSHVELMLRRIVTRMRRLNLLDPGPSGRMQNDHLQDGSAYGLGFMASDSQEFKNFVNFYSTQRRSFRQQKVRERAVEWMQMLTVSTAAWVEHLVPGEGESRWFGDEPVLAFVSPFKFFSELMKLQTPDIDRVRSAFLGRFESVHIGCRWKLEELPFLQKVVVQFERSAKLKRKGTKTPSVYVLKCSLLPTIKRVIEKLERFRLENPA